MALAPTDPTAYCFSEALQYTLRDHIARIGVPAINADFAARMAAKSSDPALAVQFTAAQIITGDKNPVSEPTICVLDPQDATNPIATGTFETAFITQIWIKTAVAADNLPEDYANFNVVITDNLRDLFTNALTYTLKPVNSAGGNVLPGGLAYAQCHWMGSHRLNFPNREADGVTYTRGLVAYHYAEITFEIDRPQALGNR